MDAPRRARERRTDVLDDLEEWNVPPVPLVDESTAVSTWGTGVERRFARAAVAHSPRTEKRISKRQRCRVSVGGDCQSLLWPSK
jgi:hypothetical protein